MLGYYEGSPETGELSDSIAQTPEAIERSGQLSMMAVASVLHQGEVRLDAESAGEPES